MNNQNTQSSSDDRLVSIKDTSQTINIKMEPGAIGEYASIVQLPVGDLWYDRKYQRYLYPSAIKSHLEGKPFNCTLARPVVAYKRPEALGGIYVGIDGQHTSNMAYIGNGPNFLINVELHYHPEDSTLEECQQQEAWHFSKLNTSRKNLTPIEQVKSGILFEDPKAMIVENNLKTLKLNIEGIGDENGYPVSNITKIGWAFRDFDAIHIQYAAKFLIEVDKTHWGRGKIKDALVHGLAAIFTLKHDLGAGTKATGLENWLLYQFHRIKESTWTKNTGGSQGHIYFARKLIEFYNQDVDRGILNFPASTIGEAALEKVGLGDPNK